MFIIVEGQRGTGKTTLCNALVISLKFTGIPVKFHKIERGSENATAIQLSQIANAVINLPDAIHIFDRFHLTEYVMRNADMGIYSVLETKKNPSYSLTESINSLLASLCGITYITTVAEKVRLSRLKNIQREDEKASTKKLAFFWEDVGHHFANTEILTNNTQEDLWNNVLMVAIKMTQLVPHKIELKNYFLIMAESAERRN